MIQAELYKRSKKLIKRKTGVLFYDCTNYFFEAEQESQDSPLAITAGLTTMAKGVLSQPNP